MGINVGISGTLYMLATLVRVERSRPELRALAHELTGSEPDRRGKMRLLVDELHRRFKYAPNHSETIGPVPLSFGSTVDADDACLFVATLATSIGIPCRFIGARYGRSWTCLVSYESSEDLWETIDPLRQVGTDREPDEQVPGPSLEET